MKFIKRHWLLLLGFLLVVPSLWPIFRSDFFRMHDFTHVARLVELDLGFKMGHFPPRWAPDFGFGNGMPLFHFYGPLPYYLAELLYLIKVPAVWAIKTVFALNYFFGFYFMHLWAREYWGKIGGWVSALAFVYLPYRAVEFYVRGALGELTAMTLMPLLFYALKKRRVILAALAWTGIFLSHNVIALFSLGLVGLYFLFTLKDWKKWLIVSVLTLLLSAWFVVPAFFEKDLTIIDSITGGYFHYSYHFIYLRQLVSRSWGYGGSILGLEDNISFQLGWPHLLLLMPAVWFWKKTKYFWLVLAISIFMMTFHSKFVWDALPILALAQFPWRFLAIVATIVAFFAGALIKNMRLATIVVAVIIVLNIGYFKPETFSPVDDYYYTDRQKISTQMSDILKDYLPKDYADFPTKDGGKTPIEFWSDTISLLSYLGLGAYAFIARRNSTRA